jgi:uncharacterized DUF497 family protein
LTIVNTWLYIVFLKFEWDEQKCRANIRKHRVDFTEACLAFLDPLRVVLADVTHSGDEPRLVCIGKTQRGILSVRYTRRPGFIRIIGAGYWRKGKRIYEKENRKIL